MHTPSTSGMPAGMMSGGKEAAVARLLIRAGGAARIRKAADLRALWHWLLGSPLRTSASGDPAPLQIEVAAEQGRRLFVLRDPAGTVEMSVGPGTYEITVVQGSRRRRYTVPLEPGSTFDLNLHDTPQAP